MAHCCHFCNKQSEGSLNSMGKKEFKRYSTTSGSMLCCNLCKTDLMTHSAPGDSWIFKHPSAMQIYQRRDSYHQRQMEQDAKKKSSTLMSLCANVIVTEPLLWKECMSFVGHDSHTEIIYALRAALFDKRMYRTNAHKMHKILDDKEQKVVVYRYRVFPESISCDEELMFVMDHDI